MKMHMLRIPSPTSFALILMGLVILTLLAIGRPGSAPDGRMLEIPKAPPAPPPQIKGPGGLVLTNVDVTLPDDTEPYPDGPHADVINANCRSCHSASMALYQPKLTRDQWHEEVEKMRNTFKAPVAEADVAKIVDYLAAMPSQRTAAADDAKTAP